MSGARGPESIAEYVAVLRGIGLTERAIADVHGERQWSGDDLESFLAEELGDATEEELHAALCDAVARSARGIDAPHEYWNHAPEVHLEELLAPYGCSVALEPAPRADTLAEGRLVVRLADAAGAEFWTRFEYPDSDLAENNYPALLHHVQTELLTGTGLRIVRLTAPPGRWRFAAMTEAQLSALRDRYGERLEILGAPVLAAEQLPAFDSQVPPIPAGYRPPEPDDGDPEASGSAIARESADSLEEVEVSDDVESGELDLGLDDGAAASPDRIVESVQQAGAGSGSTAAATGGEGVEADDDDLEAVFGDLSGVSLEPEAPDPETDAGASGGETLTIDGGTVAEGGDDPLDDLFEEIERDLADSVPTTGAEADGGNNASVSDLVSGVADDDATPRSDADEVPRTGTPDDAADLTASELFGDADDE